MIKYMELALTICTLFSFCFGLRRFIQKGSAFYLHMIIYGIGCAMLGRLFETLQLFLNGYIQSGFHVGILGVVGSFLFFYTANYGQMDSLVDDRTAAFRKYRLLALLAPLTILGLFGVYVLLTGPSLKALILLAESLVIALASYYHLKHLMIPDVDYGVIRSIRPYNLLALIYAILCMGEIILKAASLPQIYLVLLYGLLCIIMLAFVPVLERGVKKWTT